jgi:hypothetical protein
MSMRTVLRILATLVSTVATLYFAGFLVGAILVSTHLPPWISTVVSILPAVWVARFVWAHLASPHPGLARSVRLGALITGGIGFSAGFFGPIIFTPSANQGPLLGIFITGPLGLILGAVGGALYWLIRRKRGHAIGDDNAA